MNHPPPRWPLKREPTASDRAFPGYASAPAEVQLTADGLWRLTDAHGRRELQPQQMAAELYSAGWLWASSLEEAVDRVVMHVLVLEECGFLSTYIVGEQEWLSLHRPLPALEDTSVPLPHSTGSTRVIPRFDSTALGRGREEARARARERAQALEDEQVAMWAEFRQPRPADKPREVPLELLAPPIGCNDHPNGSITESCGPCGTAKEYRKQWFARQRFERQLADDEFWRGEVPADDEPF